MLPVCYLFSLPNIFEYQVGVDSVGRSGGVCFVSFSFLWWDVCRGAFVYGGVSEVVRTLPTWATRAATKDVQRSRLWFRRAIFYWASGDGEGRRIQRLLLPLHVLLLSSEVQLLLPLTVKSVQSLRFSSIRRPRGSRTTRYSSLPRVSRRGFRSVGIGAQAQILLRVGILFTFRWGSPRAGKDGGGS